MVEKDKPVPLINEEVKPECGYRIDTLVEGKLVIERWQQKVCKSYLSKSFIYNMSQRTDRKFFAVKKIFITNLIVLLIVSPGIVSGQEPNLSEIVANITEELAASDTDAEAVSTYIDRLYELVENPVRLNSSGENEISRLFFLSDFQVKALADYVHSSGKIISIYELVAIPGFDKEIVEMMIPFISIDTNEMFNSDYAIWRNTLITNISIKPGNNDSTLLGSPWKVLTKYKFTSGSFSGGFTSEKDPGEKFINGNLPVSDFFSAHFAYNGTRIIKRLIMGDFSARFGQGTGINTGIRTGLSLTAPGYMSARDEIKPYTSTDENNFFRGMASEFSINNFALTLFYSKNYSDATLGSFPGTSEVYIKSFYKAGIHNTYELQQKKDAVTETVSGANLTYNFNNIRIGLAWLNDKLSHNVYPDKDKPENIFNFQGDRNNIFTIHYNSLIKRILLFGEFSMNETNKYAMVQGISFRPSDRLTINILYRDYDAGYISFHSNGPGNNSVTGNEKGILANFTFEASKHLFISGGCDTYYFPWLKFRSSSPSMGKKQEIRVKYLPSEKLIIEASYNFRRFMVNKSETSGIPELNLISWNTFKSSVRYSPNENITLTTRVDYKIVDPSGNKGMLLLQDLNYKFRFIPVSIWSRYCIFNTDDWESRLYTYENDLLYSFNIPALSGIGTRGYIMAKWEIGDYAEIRVKYGLTSFGKGPYAREHKDEMKLQIRIRF